ncbi:MAG: bifunctional glutamate N-acetyltransferase/amino-acid acetyltransferase ArgJ [Pirellulaceae bacterium]
MTTAETKPAQANYAIPKGFRFAGACGGIKTVAGTKDVSLIVSDEPCTAAGVYTQNQVVAAPVLNCRTKTPSDGVRAVVVNSGNANACTGQQGVEDAEHMCELVAELGGFAAADTLVMSTGVIGHILPMDKVETGIRNCVEQLDNSEPAFLDSADGILTTDQFRKVGSRQLKLDGHTIRLTGMAKGAGMIGPNMATMLCTILTDAKLEPQQAQGILQRVADASFNNISVEGHTSTNDTMVLLASGASGAPVLSGDAETEFVAALTELSIELAKQIPVDGEGAAHLIEIRVSGAASHSDARTISHAIANSNLVKTAIYGNDPNWGRIVSAAGYAGPQLDMQRLKLTVNGFTLFDGGEPVDFDAAAASESIRTNKTTELDLIVGDGPAECTHWTSDLTVDYVRFNAEYTT